MAFSASLQDTDFSVRIKRKFITPSKALLDEFNAHLAQHGLLFRVGAVVDATIVAAPNSTMNEGHARDPQMHQNKQGNRCHFGMSAHIGAAAESGLVHTVVDTAVEGNDVTPAGAQLHGDEIAVHGDAGYCRVQKREEAQ